MSFLNYRFNPFAEQFAKSKQKTETNLTCRELSEYELVDGSKFHGILLQDMPYFSNPVTLIRKDTNQTLSLLKSNPYPTEPREDEYSIDFKYSSCLIWLNSALKNVQFDITYSTIGSGNTVENLIKMILEQIVANTNPTLTNLQTQLTTLNDETVGNGSTSLKKQIESNDRDITNLQNKTNTISNIYWARFDENGSRIGGNNIFSCSKTGTGRYTISHSNMNLNRSIVVTPETNSAPRVYSITSSSFRIEFDVHTVGHRDTSFSFVVVD